MASDLLVIIGASEDRGTLSLYLSQLGEAGIDVHLHDCSDRPNIDGGGNLGYRIDLFRRMAVQFSGYQFLIFSDAFDFTFYGSKHDVLSKIPTEHLLHAAEKNCYPRESSTLPIPSNGEHRYANGGIVAGTAAKFIEWCDEAQRHSRYDADMLDQHFLNILVSENSNLCVIDWQTRLFFCLYGGYPELDFERGLPVDNTYGTHPNFLHANGKWDITEMIAKYERSLR